ncbi:MAG TPA: hypothetical protein DIW31_00170 [Bacteroidales bacterium]|nr:hypothetical protein [Bacteroidales bacterium]
MGEVEIVSEELLRHFGPLSYEEIGFLLNKMATLLDKRGMNITIRKKVYAAMVESLENIYKHQDTIADDKEYMPKFSLLIDSQNISLFVSNSILNHKVSLLKGKLDKVNSLDKDGLKDLYKNTILSGNVSPKGGAGLGIINIAKVSENKVNYTFSAINDRYSYFTLNVLISHNIK